LATGRYGYDLDYCPDWYLQAWESGQCPASTPFPAGVYPVPDSMKKEYEYVEEGSLADT
jgi:hypothetical protein